MTFTSSGGDECGATLSRGAWITLNQARGALCLSCADLDHLLFLPSGDAALTRRAGTRSALSVVVLKWSRARKRYERPGLLVSAAALELAERECLTDREARVRHQEREAARRAELDGEYVQRLAARVRELFPRCPPRREKLIAKHACLKYSSRVGRSAAAKTLDETAVRPAVIARLRHAETPYDARAEVDAQIQAAPAEWEGPL